jgi:hypothetical protein
MDLRRDAGCASASQGATAMAEETATLRRCIGSARFGIEPHDVPVEDFPKQPSQKDGLGRMCKTHWNQYTAGLARDAKARAAADATAEPEPLEPKPVRRRKAVREATADASTGDIG